MSFPVSSAWNDPLPFEELRARALFGVCIPERIVDPVMLILEQGQGLHGVSIGRDDTGVLIENELHMTLGYLDEMVKEGRADITRDVDGAISRFWESSQ